MYDWLIIELPQRITTEKNTSVNTTECKNQYVCGRSEIPTTEYIIYKKAVLSIVLQSNVFQIIKYQKFGNMTYYAVYTCMTTEGSARSRSYLLLLSICSITVIEDRF